MTSVRTVAITHPIIEGIDTAEEFIAYVARVSNPSNQFNKETADKLLGYLMRNSHWSPFEMVSVVMEIKVTRDIGRQILRHKSFSFQEFSQRYAEVAEPAELSETRLQDTKNRQNSLETDDEGLIDWWNNKQLQIIALTDQTYKEAIEKGLAKEVARKVLPEGLTPSTMYMAGPLRSWIHYIQLRTENGTQKEHREIAELAKEEICKYFPSLTKYL